MSYKKNTLIARRGYSGFGAWTDTVGQLGQGILTFLQNRQQGQVDIATANAAAAQAAAQGPSLGAIAIGAGVVGGVLYFALRKR
jgi:hypothetical protein